MEEGAERSQSSGTFPLDLCTTCLETLSPGHFQHGWNSPLLSIASLLPTSDEINRAYPTALLGFNCSLPTRAMSQPFEASSKPESAQSLQTTYPYCLTLADMPITPKSRKHNPRKAPFCLPLPAVCP